MEYASNAKGNLGVTLGAIGTGLGALSGTGVLSGFMGGGNRPVNHDFVTKDEMNMMQQISQKDSEIALLKAESDSEKKMIDVYKAVHNEVQELRNDVNANRREQDLWNANQSVANATMSAAIATNTNSISAIQNVLNGITAIRVPNTAVCPGWGEVKITPVTQ